MFMKYIYSFILVLLSLCAISCDEDETFTTGTSSVLTFSRDTIAFDTVFVGVGTPTQRFKVYNPNSKGLRIPHIRLASGGESGFRVNVNGESGMLFSDVELYHKDSMYVFIELTAKPQGSDEPTEVKDSLLFMLESGKEQKVLLTAFGQNATPLKAVTFTENTTLSSERPYLVYDSLVVAAGTTLTIPAGVRLFCNNGTNVVVRGRVVCQGTYDQPVVFRGLRTDRMFSYLPYDRLDAQWGGIYIAHESQDNVFECVDIHGGNYGVYCERLIERSTFTGNQIAPLEQEQRKILMRNSSVHNVASDALFMNFWNGEFLNCEFSNAKGNCVTLVGGNTEFVHCTLAQFYPWDASHGNALYFCNVMNDTIYPLTKAYFKNCFVTGRAKDEVFGSRLENSDAAFDARFFNCAVNTDIVAENSKDYFINCVAENPDSTIYGAANFKTVDTDIYYYDFRLDSLSIARGVGNVAYSQPVPKDKDGNERPAERPDAGCYQYMEFKK